MAIFNSYLYVYQRVIFKTHQAMIWSTVGPIESIIFSAKIAWKFIGWLNFIIVVYMVYISSNNPNDYSLYIYIYMVYMNNNPNWLSLYIYIYTYIYIHIHHIYHIYIYTIILVGTAQPPTCFIKAVHGAKNGCARASFWASRDRATVSCAIFCHGFNGCNMG